LRGRRFTACADRGAHRKRGFCPRLQPNKASSTDERLPDLRAIVAASFGLHLNSYAALTAGIAFNNASYLAETFRGGLRAIPVTQTRAARSLGMSAPEAFRLVVLPQLFRVVYYPITNQMIFSVLMTALGLTVGLDTDLAGVTQRFNVLTYRTFEYFTVAAVLYYLIAKVLMLASRLAAWRLFRY
jgi:hydroxyproline transport system permease protein